MFVAVAQGRRFIIHYFHHPFSSFCCLKMKLLLVLGLSTLALLPLLVLSQSMWDSAMWTWLSGNNTVYDVGAYGTIGVPSVSNYPGGRTAHSVLFHPSSNCLFVFGGHGRATSSIHGMFPVINLESFKFIKGDLNDLWMFNITSQMWTWVSGNNTVKAVGAYGTKGVPSVSNYPGGRTGHSMVFHPSMNCLFVFGGSGRATSATAGMFPVINLND